MHVLHVAIGAKLDPDNQFGAHLDGTANRREDRAFLGVLLYVGTGIFSIFSGYNFLDYTPLKPSDPAIAESWGMTLVEYGVGITVATVMITAYNEITSITISHIKDPGANSGKGRIE